MFKSKEKRKVLTGMKEEITTSLTDIKRIVKENYGKVYVKGDSLEEMSQGFILNYQSSLKKK